MTDQHTCSYYCELPGCIRAQRDQLREWMESVTTPLTPEREAKLAEQEAWCRGMIKAIREAGLFPISRSAVADELERLIDKVPFLERYIAKLGAQASPD